MADMQKKRPGASRRSRAVSTDKSRVREPGQKKPEKKTGPEVVFMPPKPFSRNRFLLHLATVAAVVIAALLSISVFFKVENVQVSGMNKYEAHAIMEASGIRDGENLITLSRAKAASKIMKALPYIKSVRIGIKLPDTVIISVEEMQITYAVHARDDSWWLVGSNGVVVDAEPAGQRTNRTKILGLQIEVPKVGEPAVAFEQPPRTDEAGNPIPVTVTAAKQLETALEIAQQLEINHVIGEATSIDVTSIMAMEIWYGERFQFKLGDTTDLAKKIYSLKNVTDNMEGYAGGIIDLTDPNDPNGFPYMPF